MPACESPWLEEYEAFGVPESLAPYPDRPVHDFLAEAATDHPGQALVLRGSRVPYPRALGDELAGGALVHLGEQRRHRLLEFLD